MYTRLVCMERRELCKVLFPHLKEWCEYWSLWHHPVFMATVRSWMGGCGEIYTESGDAKCEIAIYRLCTLVQGLATYVMNREIGVENGKIR